MSAIARLRAFLATRGAVTLLQVRIELAFGLDPLLGDPPPEGPGGFCRDEILFHLIDLHAPDDQYEIREVLSADLPMASGSEDDRGDLVVVALPGMGGPLKPEQAEILLRQYRNTPQRAIVDVPDDSPVIVPAVLVPDPCAEATRISWENHPLAGVTLASARQFRDRLVALDGPEVERALQMLRLSAVHGFVVSARRTE